MKKVSPPYNALFSKNKFGKADVRVTCDQLSFIFEDWKKGLYDTEVYLPSINKNLQRPLIWSLAQKQKLIMSVLLERQILPIFIAKVYTEGSEFTQQVIDGKQRLTTFMQFLENEFPIILNGEEYLFDELHETIQNKILYFDLLVGRKIATLDKPMSDDDKIEWFAIMGYAGTPMDIEHLTALRDLQAAQS